MKDFFEKLLKSILVQSVKVVTKKNIDKLRKKPVNQVETVNKSKSQSWRLCPIGEHWVVTHQMKVPVSDKNPGGETTRDGHCAYKAYSKEMIAGKHMDEQGMKVIYALYKRLQQ